MYVAFNVRVLPFVERFCCYERCRCNLHREYHTKSTIRYTIRIIGKRIVHSLQANKTITMLSITSTKVAVRSVASRSAGVAAARFIRRGYHENIVEHYENPRNVGSLDKNDKSVGTVSLIKAPVLSICAPRDRERSLVFISLKKNASYSLAIFLPFRRDLSVHPPVVMS